MPEQTLCIQIRLYLKKESDQDLHCLPFRQKYCEQDMTEFEGERVYMY